MEAGISSWHSGVVGDTSNIDSVTKQVEQPPSRRWQHQNERDIANVQSAHNGTGPIAISYFSFGQETAPSTPALLMIFDIPPGASEGVHTHPDGGSGRFDEFYYIISGEGEMQLDEETLQVSSGDHVHAPMGVAHGIRNTSGGANLKLFLTAIERP